jgi:formylglycine-generating enzyme required for sulfatase activity
MPEERLIMHAPNADAPPQQGTNYLLVMGIDKYTHHGNLNNAVADAKGFAEVMTSRYGFKHLVEPLYDADATQHNMRTAIDKCESLGEHDRLIVFYAGHGWYKAKTKLGYIVPTEARENPNSDFLPINFITDIFKAVDAKHILLIVDCCFGGSFSNARDINVPSAMTEKVAVDLDVKRSRIVLSSGGTEPVADGYATSNNSPFTKSLLDILQANKQPIMAFSSIFNALRAETHWNANQIPQYIELRFMEHEGGELALRCTDLESPEERAYKAAITADSIPILEKFIFIDFPDSIHKPAIKRLIKEKRFQNAWHKVKNSTHPDKVDDFIEKFEDDFDDYPFMAEARQKMQDLLSKISIETPKPPKIITPPTPSVILPKKFDFEPDMVLVKGGTFKMGSEKYEKPVHDVTLSDFYIGKFPVIQAQWQVIMGVNPSRFKGDNLPVEQVSWADIQTFLEKINTKTSREYRLPTEAEWEFAARGGTKNQGFDYSGSNGLKEVAWFYKKSGGKTHPVGELEPNELGIYDMSGNVQEWCNDWLGEYNSNAITNPAGANTGSARVFRGGSWDSGPFFCRSSDRSGNTPTLRRHDLGFRLAISFLQ